MQALADIPECKNYYEFLQKNPELQVLPPGDNSLVFCPRNDAVASMLAEPPGSKVKRDDAKIKRAAAQQMAVGGGKATKEVPITSATASAVPSPSANTNSSAGSPQKRQVTSVPTSLVSVVNSLPTATGTAGTAVISSPGGSPATSTPVATSFNPGPDTLALDPNQLTLKTLLVDPAFVNLGPGEPGRMVSFGSPPTSAGANLKLSGGSGDIISVIRGDIPFNRGTIHIVDK